MPRATCRCGQVLTFPADGPDRVVCPSCQARIRVRKATPSGAAEPDSEPRYLRFYCPCGRRLKVRDTNPRPEAGKCPDCGQIVPVPDSALAVGAPGAGATNGAPADPETPTQELAVADAERIAQWAARFQPAGVATTPLNTPRAVPSSSGDLGPDRVPGIPGVGSTASASGVSPSPGQFEAGLRICPRCGMPVHLSAENCRQCGASVPRR